MNCPSCHGSQVQRLQVVYESGVTEVSATHHDFGGGGMVGVPIHTRGVRQTHTATRVAPPQRHSAAPAGWAFVIGGFLLYDAFRTRYFGPIERYELVLGIVALVIGWFMAKAYARMNREVAQQYDLWLRSWYCHQCGTVFN
jgi:hypothetical protein